MEELAVVLTFFAFLCMALLVGRWSLGIGRRKRYYKTLAQRYGGNVVSRLMSPRLWFRYGATMGYLKCTRHRQFKEQTVLMLTWPDKRMRFEIISPDRVFKNRRSEQVNARDLGFEREFLIQTNGPDELRRLLSHGVRWKIEQLAMQLFVESVSVRLINGKLKIAKPGVIRQFQQLDDLVRLCLELHDQLLLTKSEGIDFIDDTEAKILGDVKCPICSEDVMDEMVICLRCKTPHCKDCWQYNGHCATFACNETRYYFAGGGAAVRE